MRTPYTQLYVHLVWATWDRLPLITPEIEGRVYAALSEKCREHKCVPLAIGGIPDHVHILLQAHQTAAIATLVKELKGSTSHLVTHAVARGLPFRWQGAYGAFTVSAEGVPAVRSYIAAQKDHHSRAELQPTWELTASEEADA